MNAGERTPVAILTPMEFVTLEDLTGLYDATLFPTTFRLYSHVLSTDRPLLLEGILEEEFGAVTLTVHKLTLIGANQPKRLTAHARSPIGRKEKPPSP